MPQFKWEKQSVILGNKLLLSVKNKVPTIISLDRKWHNLSPQITLSPLTSQNQWLSIINMICNQSPDRFSHQQYWQQVHGIMLSIIWLVVADTLLLIVKYWKSWTKYLVVHSTFGLFNLLTIFAVVIVIVFDSNYLFNYCFWEMRTSAQAHFILGMMFLGMLLAVQVVGFMAKMGIESKTTGPVSVFKRKRFHIYCGYFLYILSKVQVFLGWWVYHYAWGPQLTFIVVYYVCFFAFKFLILDRWYRKQSEILQISSKKPYYNLPKYEGLIEMVSKGVNKNKIMREYPNIKYVMYKYKIYDITDLVHPGGAFIIEKVVGEEISRYIHGAYGLESTKMNAYCHTVFAQRLLDHYYIDDLDTSLSGLMVPKMGDRHNVPTTWRLRENQLLSNSVKLYNFECDRYNLSTEPNILYLGKHFLLCPLNIPLASRLYTLTLCMSPPLRAFTKSMIKRLEDETSPAAILKQKVTTNLCFVIKMYEVGGFSQYLFNCDTGDEAKIEGPFGRGLQISEGTFMAFCGGTGVLPLLDLMYEILLTIYCEKVERKRCNRLPEKFKFILYLAIAKAEFLNGLQVITKTYQLAKKYDMDIFDLNIRVSSGETIPNIPVFLPKLNADTIKSVVKEREDITKVIICGSPSMNYDLYNALLQMLPQEKLHIM